MFSLHPFESLAVPAMPFGMLADPWACPPGAGCRYQAHANYAPVAPRPVRRVVRVAPAPPRPVRLEPAMRTVREAWGVAVLIQLPYFSKDEISVEAKERTLEVSAATGPSHYYRGGALFSQSFRLGANIDADGICAAYCGGVLTLRLPYKSRKPAVRRIVVQSPAAPAPRLTTPESAPAAALPPAAPQAPAAEPAADAREEPAAHQTMAYDSQNDVEDDGAEEMPELEPLLQEVDPAEAAAAAAAAKPMSRDERAAAWVAKHSQPGAVDDEEDGSIEECDYDA